VSERQPIVIVIDDDPNFVEFIASVIEGENCRAVVATDGMTGLLLAGEVRPKLILCDYIMPGLDGGEVLQALHEDPAMRDVPRVLMSGNGCPDLRVIPADAFIAKPINTHSLRRLVRAFTGRREGHAGHDAEGLAKAGSVQNGAA
jgi:CheY-like chemotaxis protein